MNQGLKKEAYRKSIHMLGLGYIPFYLVAGKEYTLIVVASLTAIAALLEILRTKHGIFPRWILRNYEVKGVGAYLYFGISATIITAILPMEACFAGIVQSSFSLERITSV
jgi:dolichol kinase